MFITCFAPALAGDRMSRRTGGVVKLVLLVKILLVFVAQLDVKKYFAPSGRRYVFERDPGAALRLPLATIFHAFGV